MYFCKYCHENFDPVERIPLILNCGHTFCRVCINRSIRHEEFFECFDCTNRISGLTQTVVNYILLDKYFLRSESKVEENMKGNNRHFNHSYHNYMEHVTRVPNQDGETKRKGDLDISSFSNNIRIDYDCNLEPPNYNQHKCLNDTCYRQTTLDFCSQICQNQFNLKNRNLRSHSPVKYPNIHNFGTTTPISKQSIARMSNTESRRPTPEKDRFLTFSSKDDNDTRRKLKYSSFVVVKSKCRNPGCCNQINNRDIYCSDNCRVYYERNVKLE